MLKSPLSSVVVLMHQTGETGNQFTIDYNDIFSSARKLALDPNENAACFFVIYNQLYLIT